jgi:bifunctional DNA-binding transcriptional regulator/antitoxin component of YhaV-PrlF toxin-antitoxin module
MAVITVPRPLREKLGEEGTDALVALINEAGESNKKSVIEIVEERFERRLAEELGKLRAEMADLRANLVQWMFIFWIGQIGVLTGILFAFFRQ